MPLYEYVCQDCGHHFDALRSMRDADKTIPCRNCHSEQTKRALSIFFAASDGKAVAGAGGGCGSCGGGHCASCGGH